MDYRVETTQCVPYCGPYPWCSVFIDHKRTNVEITKPQEDVKCWACVQHKVKTCILANPKLWQIIQYNPGKEQTILKSNSKS